MDKTSKGEVMQLQSKARAKLIADIDQELQWGCGGADDVLKAARRQIIADTDPRDLKYEVGDHIVIPATPYRNPIAATVTKVYPTRYPWREGDRLDVRDKKYETGNILTDSWSVIPDHVANETKEN